jgi:hypothetical protein
MSKGILQLAATGKLPLQLQYREFKPQLEAPDQHRETDTTEADANASSLSGTFELIYGEY